MSQQPENVVVAVAIDAPMTPEQSVSFLMNAIQQQCKQYRERDVREIIGTLAYELDYRLEEDRWTSEPGDVLQRKRRLL